MQGLLVVEAEGTDLSGIQKKHDVQRAGIHHIDHPVNLQTTMHELATHTLLFKYKLQCTQRQTQTHPHEAPTHAKHLNTTHTNLRVEMRGAH